MDLLILVVIVIFLIFALVVLRGAPYLPTLNTQVEQALDLLDLKPGQTLLELGSGDGRFLKSAAERGIRSIGYELNPLLVLWTKLYLWRYRKVVQIKWGDFWRAEWPKSDGMYVFLLERYMNKLDKKVIQYSNGQSYKLVSYGYVIPGKKPTKSIKGLRLYTYN